MHVFAGSLDELCSPSTSALVADTLKLGTLHLVRGVGHISGMMECWQVIVLLVRACKVYSTRCCTVTCLQEAFILASGSALPVPDHGPLLSV